MILQGGKLAGGNPTRGRVNDDFYATPNEATEALFGVETFVGNVWEPACGNGMKTTIRSAICHICKEEKCTGNKLFDRGFKVIICPRGVKLKKYKVVLNSTEEE